MLYKNYLKTAKAWSLRDRSWYWNDNVAYSLLRKATISSTGSKCPERDVEKMELEVYEGTINWHITYLKMSAPPRTFPNLRRICGACPLGLATNQKKSSLRNDP